MDVIQYILNETSWLYTKIYQNNFLFLDLWSVVHFWSGLVIYLILRTFGIKHPFRVLIGILLMYEITELLFIFFAFNIFKPETLKDQVTDLLVGFSGGVLSSALLNLASRYYQKYKYLVSSGMMLLASITYAFAWVGFYHYSYSVPSLNTGGGMNYYTFMGWTAAGFLILQFIYLVRMKNFILKMILTWTIYFICLLIFESFTYYVLGIHENSLESPPPLIFGVIHGSQIMHIFYMINPFMFYLLYRIGAWFLKRAIHFSDSKVPSEIYKEVTA